MEEISLHKERWREKICEANRDSRPPVFLHTVSLHLLARPSAPLSLSALLFDLSSSLQTISCRLRKAAPVGLRLF